MLCKLDFAVTYCFGHNTCNSGPFLLKICSKDAYLRGVHSGSLNQLKLVFIGSEQFFHPGMPELQLTVQFFAVQSSSVAVFFQFDELDL